MTFGEGTSSRDTLRDSTKHRVSELPVNWWVQPSVIWNLYTLNNGGAFMAPEPDDDDDETWVLFNAMNGNRAEMSPEAAGIAACLMTYSHHACRTCYAMTVHYYRLRDYALQHPECSAIMRIID